MAADETGIEDLLRDGAVLVRKDGHEVGAEELNRMTVGDLLSKCSISIASRRLQVNTWHATSGNNYVTQCLYGHPALVMANCTLHVRADTASAFLAEAYRGIVSSGIIG